MADHFQVNVYAFLTHTDYGDVLRDKDRSWIIAARVRDGRQTDEGQVIEIPPDHEALPHPGLGDGLWSFLKDELLDRGPRHEGVHDYALWRK